MTDKALKRIILIGNGFDLAHGLKTSYGDFMTWFWVEQVKRINDTESKDWKTVSKGENAYKIYQKDDFFDVKFHEKESDNITNYDKPQKEKSERVVPNETDCVNASDNQGQNQKQKFTSVGDFQKNIEYKNKFLEIVEKRKTLQNWVDIEELYFEILKNCKDRYKQSESVYEIYTVEQLNKDFSDIKQKLSEFLKKRNNEISGNNDYRDKLNEDIVKKLKEIISEGNPDKVIFLNFNYTNTIFELYKDIPNATEIQIHGCINDNDNPVIFGYGDEISKDSTDIEDLNENAFLENVKSIKYVETDNYSKLLGQIGNEGLIRENYYDVFVFGHSCGNSDRTLLKALFENKNCEKIRCFYYKDDYNKTIDNIYRKFEDKTAFRIKICQKNKEQDVFPQFVGESPFKDEARLLFATETEKTTEDKYQVEGTPIGKEQSEIEKYKKENMVEVVFDNASTAYNNISNKVASKKSLKQDFYIGKYQVTQKEWQEIMGNNPSHFKGDTLPVERVSWYDCIEFCNKMSDKHGLRKYYNINGNDVTFNTDADGFRLPTEAEWEYAARGGKKSKNYEYSGSNNVKDVAWYYENSGTRALKDDEWSMDKLNKNKCKTHEVGTKQSNELDLYDMSGNVDEWCEDRSDRDSLSRILRGGSWYQIAWGSCVSYRTDYLSSIRADSNGFRLALTP